MSSIEPEAEAFFSRFPTAREAYAGTPLYHQTHSRYVPGILQEGLMPNHRLFPQEHGAFLLHMYRQHSTWLDQNNIDHITNRIIESNSTAFVSSQHPDEVIMDYGVPERLMLLMRGLAALATKTSLSDHERRQAALMLDEHRTALSENNPRSVMLEINPLAPAAIHARLSRHDLALITNEADALLLVEYCDGNDRNNIALGELVEPAFIHVSRQTPLDPTLLQSVDRAPDWTRYIP